jgi:hypothetical protein
LGKHRLSSARDNFHFKIHCIVIVNNWYCVYWVLTVTTCESNSIVWPSGKLEEKDASGCCSVKFFCKQESLETDDTLSMSFYDTYWTSHIIVIIIHFDGMTISSQMATRWVFEKKW